MDSFPIWQPTHHSRGEEELSLTRHLSIPHPQFSWKSVLPYPYHLTANQDFMSERLITPYCVLVLFPGEDLLSLCGGNLAMDWWVKSLHTGSIASITPSPEFHGELRVEWVECGWSSASWGFVCWLGAQLRCGCVDSIQDWRFHLCTKLVALGLVKIPVVGREIRLRRSSWECGTGWMASSSKQVCAGWLFQTAVIVCGNWLR